MSNKYHTSYLLDRDKKLDVFDNVFSHKTREYLFGLALESSYKIGWGDSEVPERKAYDYFLHSIISNDSLNNIDFFKELKEGYVGPFIEQYTSGLHVMNLSTPSDVFYTHTHNNSKVMLYYVNMEWKQNWFGETQFYSEDEKDIQLCLPYTPGRLVIFDAGIPHTIRPQSVAAPHYRFTLVTSLSEVAKNAQ